LLPAHFALRQCEPASFFLPTTMKIPLLTLFLLVSPTLLRAADFKRDIVPILKAECYKCHSEESGKEKGDFVFDNTKRFSKDIGPGRVIEPGKPEESRFLETLSLEMDDDAHMPPKKNLTAAQIAKFKEWIAEGATFDGSKATAATAPATAAPEAAPASSAASSLPPAPTMQNWTNTEGKVIQAAMLKLEGENVVLQMANGQTYNYPLGKLAPESQELAKRGGR
jgi:hypothetical protein